MNFNSLIFEIPAANFIFYVLEENKHGICIENLKINFRKVYFLSIYSKQSWSCSKGTYYLGISCVS